MSRIMFEEDFSGLRDIEDPDLSLLQCAQDPLEGFSEDYPELSSRNRHKKSKSKRETAKPRKLHEKSYVIHSNKKKGRRLIQIKVFDLLSDDSEESLVLNTQYVVRDMMDDVMDDTESVIRKISKKLCSDIDI